MTLFRGATFVLTPTLRTTDEACYRLARELVAAVGARAGSAGGRAARQGSGRHQPPALPAGGALVQTETQASM